MSVFGGPGMGIYPGASYGSGSPYGVPYGPQAPAIVPQGGTGGYAINGPVDIVVPKAPPGVPLSSLPPVIVRPAQGGPSVQPGYSPLPAPSYQVGGVPYAQSFPVAPQAPSASLPFPPLVDVPPPHVVAPWLFYNPPHATGGNGPGNPNSFQNNYYNNYGQPIGPGGYPYGPPSPYGQPPVGPPNPMLNPNGQQPPPQLPQPPQENKPPEAKKPDKPPEEPKPEEPKADTKNPPKIPNASTLTDEQVKSLNRQLNDPAAGVRSNGAMDLFKILEANPDITNHPSYKPYIDAFVLKILGDPSPLVRQPLLLAMELGHLKQVAEPAIHLLEKLSKGNGLWGKEPDIIRGILPNLNPPEPPPLPSTTAHPNPLLAGDLDDPNGAHAGTSPHFGHRLNHVSAGCGCPDAGACASGHAPDEAASGRRLNVLSTS